MVNRSAANDDSLSLALEFQRTGHVAKAKAECLDLLRRDSKQAAAWNLLGFLEHEEGNGGESIRAFEKAVSADPEFADAHFNLGNIFRIHDKPRQVAAAYRAFVSINRDDVEAHFHLANSLLSLDELETAETSFRDTLRLDSNHIDARTNLGYCLKRMGRYKEAAEHLRYALELNPKSAECHNNLGTVLCDLRQFEPAVATFRSALKLKPTFIEAHNNLGHALFDMGRIDAAVEAFGRALELNPGDLHSYINLAGVGERANRLDIAKDAIARGFQIDPRDASPHLLTAKIERRDGRVKEAIERLENIDPSGNHDLVAIDIAFELGQLYDRSDSPDQAFRYFTEGNRLSRQYPAHRHIDKNEFLDLVGSLDKAVTQDWLSSWSQTPQFSSTLEPAFIVGFPRSDTTLTEQILNAHPSLQTLDEKPTFDVMLAHLANYPRSMARLTDTRINALRTIYYDAVAEHVEGGLDMRIVDKMPLNIIHVTAIRRFFPTAKIILVMRNPCDSCLSCFMQNFTVNSSMANFFTLEDTARLYAKVMSLWGKCADLLKLDFHVIRYEDLVGDFESETRKMLNFLGVEWHEAGTEFAAHARARGKILTPSYHQVTQEIYQHATYRWQRYRDEFEGLRELLEPFVTDFGYRWDQ